MSSLQVVVGIDLGSTTTKAVILDEDRRIVGKGITNSRSNYDVASRVSREEAFVRARFFLAHDAIEGDAALAGTEDSFLPVLERKFRYRYHLEELDRLEVELMKAAGGPRHKDYRRDLEEIVGKITKVMAERAVEHFSDGAERKSDFFRDLAAADFMQLAEGLADPRGIRFEVISSLFDQAILPVENTTGDEGFERMLAKALDDALSDGWTGSELQASGLRRAVGSALSVELDEVSTVGTGYGRARLPFPREQIRSEILCHGLGAHSMFPQTRTVLDIGGQDTKAIQVDDAGIVTSFQMNDRCAAGCGRYLGYIADEMNLGVQELGPLAQKSTSFVKINSTCTVFAGAELRERLSLGQRREDILAGLHRSIILRAMSLLARSGGVDEEFTFTGGVARNPAAVAALEDLVKENYGEKTLNISPASIYTGALGAALFARQQVEEEVA